MRRTRSVTGVQRKEVRLKKLERGEKKKRNMEEMKEKGRETRKMYHVYPAIDDGMVLLLECRFPLSFLLNLANRRNLFVKFLTT